MNNAEHVELQRHVEELLDNGYIKESLSPCKVPALLGPKKDGTYVWIVVQLTKLPSSIVFLFSVLTICWI